MTDQTAGGRPRDPGLDDAILDAATALLGEVGFEALTMSAVAERAGTTRPAVYRRYDDKAAVAIAALTALSADTAPARSGDHFADLVAELTAFRDAIAAASGLSLAGAVLQGSTDGRVVEAYRRGVVEPRRSRLGAIIRAAQRDGELDASSREQAVAVTMCTGSWYGHAIAGRRPPHDWPSITARLVWRGLGGAAR